MRGVSCVASSRPPNEAVLVAFPSSSVSLLGVAPRRSGERVRLHLGQAVGFLRSGVCSFCRFTPALSSTWRSSDARKVGTAPGLGQTAPMRAKFSAISPPHNMSIDTDAQVRPCASAHAPRVRRSFSRYTAEPAS
jgi:hypothetical protein